MPVLIARIDSILPLICPVWGSEMRLIDEVTEREPQRILRHIGESPLHPPVSHHSA